MVWEALVQESQKNCAIFPERVPGRTRFKNLLCNTTDWLVRSSEQLSIIFEASCDNNYTLTCYGVYFGEILQKPPVVGGEIYNCGVL